MTSPARAFAIYRIDGMKLESKLNQRVHWTVRSKQARLQREAAFYSVKKHELHCIVKITRVGPRALDDDNLAGSCKSIRDGIADRLGIDDRSEAVAWRYAQRKGPYGVEIEFLPMPTEMRVQCVQPSLLAQQGSLL
jgi:hypothetical protein